MFACHVACMHDSTRVVEICSMPSILVVLSAYNEASHMHGLCGDGVNGVDGVDAVSGGVGGVECRGCRTMSMCFDSLDTNRALLLSRSLDTGVGVSGLSVGLVSVDTSVGVSGGVGRCRDRVSECRARAQVQGCAS